MGAGRIKGITLEIGGDTTGLNKALESVGKKLNETQAALKDVNKMLKLDPTNTELLAQKHKLLQQAIQETEGKLKTLKTASEQAAKTAGNYDAWKAAYTPVQEEVVKTNEKIDKLKKSMKTLEETGKIDTEEYKQLQSEVDESTDRLKVLKEQKKQIDEEFGKPISPEAFDSLQREIIETENSLKELNNTAGSSSATLAEISAKTGKFGDQATAAGKKLLPVSAAIGGLGAAAVKTASDFDSSMSNVQAISGATADEMEKLREKAREMGEKTKFSAQEAGDAMSYMAMAGWKTEDMLNGIEGIMNLAAASGEDLATTSDIVTDALTAFGMSASESGNLADIMAAASSNANTNVSLLGESFKYVAPLFGAMNYSAEDATTALGLMANAGIKGSQAGTSLKNAIANMVKPTDAMATVMDKYKLSLTNTDGSMKSFSEVMEMLRKKMGGLSETEQAAAASTLFGKEAMAGMLSIINAAPEDYEKLTKAVSDADGMSKKMADTMNDNLAGQVTILKSQLQELAISIGELLMPYIRKAVKVIQDIVNKFNGMGEAQKKIIVIIGLILAVLGPLLITIGKIAQGVSAVTSVLSKLSGIGGLITKFGGIVKSVLSGIGTAVKALFGLITAHPVIAIITVVIGAIVLLYNKCKWFRDGVNAIWKAIKTAFTDAWDGILEFFTKTIPEAWNSVVSFFKGVPEWWSGLWEGIKAKFSEVWNSILANPVVLAVVSTITTLIESLKTTLSGIWDGIRKIASGAWELIKNAILGPVLLLIDLVTGDFEKIKSDAEHIWNNIKEAASNIWNGIMQVITSFSDGTSDYVKSTMNWMKDIVSSIWNSIKGIASDLWNGIKETISNLVNETKDAAVNGFKSLKNGVKNAITSLPDIVRGIFKSIERIISDLISNAWNWGADFINGLKEGIMSGIESIVGKVKGLGDKIRSYLHFSRPDEGPLRDYETWMPDFMAGLSKGIDQNSYKVLNSVKKVAGIMSNGMSGGINLLAESGGQQVNVNNEFTVQIGDEQFDAYIVKKSTKGIGGKQYAGMRAKGGRNVRGC